MTDRSEKYFKSQKYIKLYTEIVYDGFGIQWFKVGFDYFLFSNA